MKEHNSAPVTGRADANWVATCTSGRTSDGVTSIDFRRAMSRLAAGVSIITTIAQDGHKLGLTATAVSSLSLDPPLVLVCIDNRSRVIAPLQARAPFIVHFLAADQQNLAQQFASPIPDKYVGVAYHPAPSGCTRLDGTLTSVECVAHACFPGGDHTIVVGRVVDIQAGRDAALPLIHFAGHYMHF